MNKYKFHATNIIAKVFEAHGAKFDVDEHHGIEYLSAGFSVKSGPIVFMRFISCDNDNDVKAGVFGLLSNTPAEKRYRLMEACNILNGKIPCMKFNVDFEGNINMQYDFPVSSGDDCIGEMAFEIFVRAMSILDSEYDIFMKALYSDEDLSRSSLEGSINLMQRLQELRKQVEAKLAEEGSSDVEENDDFSEVSFATEEESLYAESNAS